MWIWEGYINPNKHEQFMACANKLRNVNPHVLQDIEDHLLLEGFKHKKVHETKKAIESDLQARRPKKKNRGKEDEEEEKEHDRKRGFLNQVRPPYAWNFFEEEDKKTPHVLRHDADPRKCYIDGRIEDILEDIS